MPRYVRDPEGVTHIVDFSGNGEFTFCSMEFGCQNIDDEDGNPTFGQDGEFFGEFTSGPANCDACKEQIKAIRESISGVRWSHKMTMPMNP